MQSASCLSFTQEKHFHGITAGQIPIDWSWRWASNVREDKGKAEEKQIVFPSLANHLYTDEAATTAAGKHGSTRQRSNQA